MELKEMLSKKPVRFLTLLFTAMLIATASAAVYYSMNMQSTVDISQASVIFEEGLDWAKLSAGSLGANSTSVSLTIKAYPNATLTYEEPLNISNTVSGNKDVRFRHVSITPNAAASVSNFTFINFTLNGQDFDYYTTGDNWNAPSDMGYQTMSGNTKWAVKIETKAAAGATVGLSCTIVIALEVRE